MKFITRFQKKSHPRFPAFFLLRLLVPILVIVLSLSFVVTPVLALPTIIGSALPTGQVGTAYLAILTAVPLSGTPTWAVTSGALPPGITLTPSNGTISGTPTAAGTFPFFVQVTDSSGTSPQQSFFITISPPPFTIATTDMPQSKEGSSYTVTLSVTGGTSPFNWNLASGTLPLGLTLQATSGVISGTISKGTAGTSTFIVNVTDSSSPPRSAQRTFSIYIEKGAYQTIVTISTGLTGASTKVFVDTKTTSTLRGGESVTLTFDLATTHAISVDPIVASSTDNNVRYKAKDETITVSEQQPNADFTYYTEYMITVKNDPVMSVTPQGSGWFRKDSVINATTKTEVEGSAGTLYRFAYWILPNGNQVPTEQLNFTVDGASTLTAKYDTFYKLTVESLYGEVEGSGWYKANSQARWLVVNDKVGMPGLVGFFQGKYKASNPSGNETMDKPKTVTVFWEPDYSLPYVLIPVTIIIFILAIAGIYFLLRRQQPLMHPQPQPQPFGPPMMGYPPPYMPPPPPPRPIPQQHTTVVMIGDNKGGAQPKQLPSSTKEQLMEKFGELLEKYETEIKSPSGQRELPRGGPVPIDRMIPSPRSHHHSNPRHNLCSMPNLLRQRQKDSPVPIRQKNY